MIDVRSLIIGVVVAVALIGVAAFAYGAVSNDSASSKRDSVPISVTMPTSSPSTAPVTLVPSPSPTRLPDRTSCSEIRGTTYRSDTEEAWYLVTCQPSPTPSIARAIPTPDLSAAFCKSIKLYVVTLDAVTTSHPRVRSADEAYAVNMAYANAAGSITILPPPPLATNDTNRLYNLTQANNNTLQNLLSFAIGSPEGNQLATQAAGYIREIRPLLASLCP